MDGGLETQSLTGHRLATEEARSLAAGEERRVEVKIKGEVKSRSEIRVIA